MMRLIELRYRLGFFIIFPFIMILTTNSAKCGENGILGGIVVNRAGDRLRDAAIELFSSEDMKLKHSTKTNRDGVFRINGIADGTYNLQIRVPGLWAYSRYNIRIIDDREIYLGTIAITGFDADCSEPGVTCTLWGLMSRPLPQLSCMNGLKLLLNSQDKPDLLQNEELQRRAIVQVQPKWPIDAHPGYEATILVVIGTDGTVLCADILGQDDAILQAALFAARGWRFQPILENGAPIAAMGSLTFEVPQKSRSIP